MTTLTDTIKLLKELEARATSGPWEWDGRKQDEDGYVFIPQGSYLGDTMICLADTYENCSYDLDLIAAARNHLMEIVQAYEEGQREIERLNQENWDGIQTILDQQREIERLKRDRPALAKFAIETHRDVEENGGSYTYEGIANGTYEIQIHEDDA